MKSALRSMSNAKLRELEREYSDTPRNPFSFELARRARKNFKLAARVAKTDLTQRRGEAESAEGK